MIEQLIIISLFAMVIETILTKYGWDGFMQNRMVKAKTRFSNWFWDKLQDCKFCQRFYFSIPMTIYFVFESWNNILIFMPVLSAQLITLTKWQK